MYIGEWERHYTPLDARLNTDAYSAYSGVPLRCVWDGGQYLAARTRTDIRVFGDGGARVSSGCEGADLPAADTRCVSSPLLANVLQQRDEAASGGRELRGRTVGKTYRPSASSSTGLAGDERRAKHWRMHRWHVISLRCWNWELLHAAAR